QGMGAAWRQGAWVRWWLGVAGAVVAAGMGAVARKEAAGGAARACAAPDAGTAVHLWEDGAVARADGRLSHDLMPDEKAPQDECGVFGVWAPGEEVAKLTYYGLYALQHRGQEAAGIATSDGRSLLVYKDVGLVSQVFDESSLASLRGHLAVGHCRYSTTGRNSWENAQPTLGGTLDQTVALAHNGNLINTTELRERLCSRYDGDLRNAPGEVRRGNTTDTA